MTVPTSLFGLTGMTFLTPICTRQHGHRTGSHSNFVILHPLSNRMRVVAGVHSRLCDRSNCRVVRAHAVIDPVWSYVYLPVADSIIARETGERVFLVAAIAIGIIVPVVGALYAGWMLMH